LEYIISMDNTGDNNTCLSMNKLIEKGQKLIEQGNRMFIDTEIDPSVMNMLIFTSGTTDKSKGVMLSHKNIASNVYNMSKYVHIKEPGVGLSVLPMHQTTTILQSPLLCSGAQ